MGIKNLNTFLKQNTNSENIFRLVPTRDFYACRIAVDATNRFYALWSQAYRIVVERTDVCYEEPSLAEAEVLFYTLVKQFLVKMIDCQCTPILVFDGKHPEEKFKTQQDRREKKQVAKNKIIELRDTINKIDVLERTLDMGRQLKKLYCQNVSPPYGIFKRIQVLLSELGFPSFQAKDEAEQLCCMMCLDGYASAVMSTDTDVLVYSCSLLITGFGSGIYNPQTRSYDSQFTCVYLNSILKELNMSQSTFVDFCIMCGCDYNTNMSKIASGNSYKLITRHGSIDQLPSKYDISCLNHEFCRERFKPRKSLDVSDSQFEMSDLNVKVDMWKSETVGEDGSDSDPKTAIQILKQNDLTDWYPDLSRCVKFLPTPNSGIVIQRPTTTIPFKLKVSAASCSSFSSSSSSASSSSNSSSPHDFIDSMIADLLN